MLINPELKDKLLDKFVSADKIQVKSSVTELSKYLSVDSDVVCCLLDNFEDSGLCTIQRYCGGAINVILNAKAYDMYRRGGFAAIEYLYQKELLKLEKELEKLQKAFPDKVPLFNSALTLINTIRGFF